MGEVVDIDSGKTEVRELLNDARNAASDTCGVILIREFDSGVRTVDMVGSFDSDPDQITDMMGKLSILSYSFARLAFESDEVDYD